jgi:hypothetical protein
MLDVVRMRNDPAEHLGMLDIVPEERLLQHFVLPPHFPEFKTVTDRCDEARIVRGFEHVVIGPHLHALDSAVNIVDRCDDDDVHVRMVFRDLRQEIPARQVGHVDIEHDKGVLARGQETDDLPAVAAGLDIR